MLHSMISYVDIWFILCNMVSYVGIWPLNLNRYEVGTKEPQPISKRMLHVIKIVQSEFINLCFICVFKMFHYVLILF